MSETWSWILPDPGAGALAGGMGLAWGILLSRAVDRLRRRGVRIPYTRKVFHFGIFSGAAVVHAAWGLGGTNAYGAAVALLVLRSVVLGDASALYRALARDTDRPERTLFIVVPLVTTAVGGLASALWTGPYAVVGYLVAGWGDAVGEPVGTRFGRHPYTVPSLAGVAASRTLEGSLAVFVTGWAAAVLALATLGWSGPQAVGVAGASAAVGTLAEAVSHHGLDNLTVQIAASGAAWALLA